MISANDILICMERYQKMQKEIMESSDNERGLLITYAILRMFHNEVELTIYV